MVILVMFDLQIQNATIKRTRSSDFFHEVTRKIAYHSCACPRAQNASIFLIQQWDRNPISTEPTTLSEQSLTKLNEINASKC